MSYIGDYAAGDTIDFKFTTRRFSSGAPYQLAGTPAISVYKSNSTTQSTSGVTLTVDFDSVTGLNHVRIDTTADGTFYADGSQFEAVITTGTVDSVSVVGERVARFTLRAQASLYPTTAGRKLDVSTGGEAGIDWANVGSPTTTLNLSGTTVKTATDVETDTADIQSRLPAALVSGRIDASVGAMASGVLTATAIASDALTAAKVASDVGTEIATAVWAAATRVLTAGTNIDGSTFNSIPWNSAWDAEVQSECADALTAFGASTLTAAAAADAVWDEAISGHLTGGSTGAALNGAGSAGDPWGTTVPGAYSAGTAGYILGTNLNATVSSRLASASYTAPLDAAGTRSAVGLASANLDTQFGDLPTAAENATAVLTTQMTEAYAADGSAPTLAQMQFMIWSFLAERSISSVTLTAKKLDGSTTAMTFTLNDGTTPTAITRAT